MAWLCVFSSSARAIETHALQYSFDGSGSTAGPFADLGGIAIHESTGDVYAIDRTNQVIDKFDAQGNPKNFSSLGASSLSVDEVCPGFQFPPGPGGGYAGYYRGLEAIAVDSSGGGHDGNIYLANPAVDPGAPPGVHSQTCAINEAGEFLWSSSEHYGLGMTVDESGHLWFATFDGAYEFEDTGSPPEIGNILGTGSPIYSIAIDSQQNFFLYESNKSQVARWTLAGRQATIIHYDPNNTPGHGPMVTVDPATDHLYIAHGNLFEEYNSGATQLVGTFAAEDLNDIAGIAINGASGDVYVSNSPANRVLVYSGLKEFANVTTGDAEEIRRTTAVLTGHIDPANGGPVTACHVEYGLDKNYGESAPCNPTVPYSDTTSIRSAATGLQPNTTYHYRVFATDASGTNRGVDRTFKTPFVSGVETESASNVARTTATLNGSLDPENISTSYYFQWGLTVGYGNTQPTGPPGESVGSTPGQTPVAANIEDLEPATTYHYRLVGVNSEGKTLGADRTLTTPPSIAALNTQPPSDVGPNDATLNGSFDPDGFDTSYYYEWGPTTAYGSITPALPGADAGSAQGVESVPVQISGLDAYSTYHYRLVATNGFGTTIGEDVAFLSAPPFLPSVDGTEAQFITATGATLKASINPGFGPTVFRFQYGPSSSYGSRTALSAPVGADGIDHAVSVQIGGLQPATTYHYRAVAINFSGSSPGPDRTFTTAGLPSIDATMVSDVTQTSFRVNAQIRPNSSPTTYRIEYGTDGLYGARTDESAVIGSDSGLHTVASYIAGLKAGTTYHFRVVATNGLGTVLGPDRAVTTATSPVQEHGQLKCKRGFTKRHGRCVRTHHRRQHKKRHHNKPRDHRHVQRSHA